MRIPNLIGLALVSSAACAAAHAASEWKLSFAPGPAPAGWIQVAPGAAYASDPGYGFESGSQVQATPEGVTGSGPFYFSAALPEGNYRVSVVLEGADGGSVTTVKAELRRLMLQQIPVAAGQSLERTFTVALRRPQYPGGVVRLKAREKTIEAWDWDDKMTLEFCGERPCVRSIRIEPAPDLPTIFGVGDSTMTDQPREPFNSWGQMITRFFGPDIVFSNHAESGESARSFFGERRWPKLLSVAKPGDYILLQFGHNDQHDRVPGSGAFTSYKGFLEKFADDARQHGLHLIFVTPMNRRTFDASGHIRNDLGDYPAAMRAVAKEKGVPLVDLNAMSKVLYETLGPSGTIAVFATSASGRTDTTHQSDYGSYELAQCVLTGLRTAAPELVKYFTPDAPHFDPAHPDPVADFTIPKEPVTTSVTPYGH